MFIQTEQTPNPQTLKFLPGKAVMNEGTAFFQNVNETSNELSNLSIVVDNLTQSSNSIEKIVNEISNGDGSLNKLIFEDDLINSLDEASKNINLLIKDLRLNPKRYVHFSLFGKKNVPYKEDQE